MFIREVALTQTALTSTSVLPVKEITLRSTAQQGRDPSLVSNNIQASSPSLTLECEASLSQQCLSLCLLHHLYSALSLLCLLIHSQVILLITHFMTHHPFRLKQSHQNIIWYHYHSSLWLQVYNSSLHLICPEYNEYNVPLVSVSFSQQTHSIIYWSTSITLATIPSAPKHLWFLKPPYMHLFWKMNWQHTLIRILYMR